MSAETETATDEPRVNLTVLAALFVVGLTVALALPNLGSLLPAPAEPVSDLTVYRVEYREGEVVAHVLNTGPVPAEIGAVQIGGPFPAAIRDYHAEPSEELPRMGQATVHIPFEWRTNEVYEVTVITTGGAAFSGEAMARPQPTNTLQTAVALGFAVGIVPVFLGIAPYPWFRRWKPSRIRLLGGVAAGVLAFLLVDTLAEAGEIASRLPLTVGPTLVVGGFLAGLVPLVWYGRTKLGPDARTRAPLAAAYLVAVAIGLHNFGEGLAIGAAHATGAVALAALLAVGFALHNVTEGVAIVAPALEERFDLRHPIALGLIAGAPVIPGAAISFTFYTDAFAALFFSVAVGAILYVVAEILLGLAEDAPGGGHDDPWIFGGLAIGLVIMYATDVLLHALIGGG